MRLRESRSIRSCCGPVSHCAVSCRKRPRASLAPQEQGNGGGAPTGSSGGSRRLTAAAGFSRPNSFTPQQAEGGRETLASRAILQTCSPTSELVGAELAETAGAASNRFRPVGRSTRATTGTLRSETGPRHRMKTLSNARQVQTQARAPFCALAFPLFCVKTLPHWNPSCSRHCPFALNDVPWEA